jgi:hypothetical protein
MEHFVQIELENVQEPMIFLKGGFTSRHQDTRNMSEDIQLVKEDPKILSKSRFNMIENKGSSGVTPQYSSKGFERLRSNTSNTDLNIGNMQDDVGFFPDIITPKTFQTDDMEQTGFIKGEGPFLTYGSSTDASLTTPVSFHCGECEFSTSHKSNLRKHVNVVHKNIKNYGCDECMKRFSKKHNLKDHLKRNHVKV